MGDIHLLQWTVMKYIEDLLPFTTLPPLLTSHKQQISDLSKLKEFADGNFRFDEDGRKFFKRIEKTVGKGEIARYEQFLLFPQCFQKTCTAHT